ncbi:hypothetical protein [Asanoa sp. NPDC050611]|uniref:hypothetical protein n=1 Tax=Asanoa sp. NPDC050611 TaxID=3157098 RepID=UPI0033C6B806
MRHLATVIAAVVLGPATWVLIAFGQDRSVAVFDSDSLSGGDPLGAFVFLAAAGLLLGVIGTLRFSPLGATLVGLGYLGSAAAAVFAPGRVIDLFDHTLTIAGRDGNLATPVRTGSAAILGALLVVAVASAKRWRRWPEPATPEAAEDEPLIPLDPRGGDTELVGSSVGFGTQRDRLDGKDTTGWDAGPRARW